MDWIKRNLLFVIGSAISVILMGLAGWYLYAGMGQNTAALDKLNEEYATLDNLSKQNPHPGNDKINNIQAAKDQEKMVREFIGRTAVVFKPIPAIPPGTNADNAMLAGALRQTLEQMRKDASSKGVQVATNYYFSFTAEKDRIMFDKAGVLPLSTQLGEVKAICDVLFAARINALDNIRREKVCIHDVESTQVSDYLDSTTMTNEVALISPYEVSLRCFSSEVGNLLAGFASSPHGLVIKAINVEPAVLGAGVDPAAGPTMFTPQPMYPGGMPGYGPRPGLGMEEGMGRPAVPPPVAYNPAVGAGAPKPGLQTLLDEKQLKVTLLVHVLKLNPTNSKK